MIWRCATSIVKRRSHASRMTLKKTVRPFSTTIASHDNRRLMGEVRCSESVDDMLTANFGQSWGLKCCVLNGARCMQLGVLISKSDMHLLQRALNDLRVPWETRLDHSSHGSQKQKNAARLTLRSLAAISHKTFPLIGRCSAQHSVSKCLTP